MYTKKLIIKEKKFRNIIRFINLIIIIFLVISGNNAFAEKDVGVTGQVKEAKTKKPIEFCTVKVFNLKDSLLTGATTDMNGFFSVPLTRGNYKFVTEYIGYKSDTIKVSIKTGTEFIGIIKLRPDENSIGEVTISGTTSEIETDKDVFLVTSKMKTGTANTKDVLDKIKGVSYDRYNNSIKVDNEDNIIILVNGLQKDQEYIKNLAPDRLKRIEVIRDPSGRYALEGYSAVINVILKNDYKGLEFYSANQMLSDIDNKNGNYFPINNFSVSLNYTYNKVNLYAKVNNGFMDLALLSTNKKEYDSGLSIIKEPENNQPNFLINRIFDRITVGADFYINPKHTLSFESNFSGLIFPQSKQESIFDVSYFNNGSETDNFSSDNITNTTSRGNYNSLFYKGILNKNNILNIDFTYSSSNDNYTTDYSENGILKNKQTGINDNKYTKFYAELNHTINSKSNVQIGYGNTYKKVVNTFNFGETDFTRTDLRHKLYAYYSWNLNKKFGIKLGAAGETSTPNVEGKTITYFIYQPYADIKIKPFKMLDIRLKYRSSSNYPSVNEANPDTIFIDNETVRTGNPLLEPSVTHKLSVRFNIMHGLASFEPYYHFSNNYISQIGTLQDDGIFQYTYANAGQYKHYGFKVGLTVPFGKSLFWQNNANFFKSSINYKGEENHIKDWTMSSNLIYVNKKYKTTTGLIYQNNLKKVITAQGYNMWNNDFWGFMVQQPFFKQKLNVMIFYMLPVNIGVDYQQGSYIRTDTYQETNLQDISILKNILMFRITFRLNKGKSIRKTKKEFKQEEETPKKGGII
ncbi:MAG: outer membrane beta-barrel protein [Chlorobi bacterium]|nr:outer membrane beta-barrel protein [Chlorobiota bacterium]